ncbi:MAG: SDR family oxidoreductase [Rhodothermales bacterium]|nr:SDR family oxidoreductase [Rhodothermales bacterium]
MRIDLTGKTALVTGASKGIGRAIALRLAEAGARVAVHYRSGKIEADELAAQLDGAISLHADLQDMDQVRRLFSEASSLLGGLDIVVNNAGIAIGIDESQSGPEWEHVWDSTMKVNLKALTLLCRLAIEHFKERGGGRLVNISSRAAFRGDTKDYMDYAASKGGVVALTRSIARAFGKQGIKAFNVAPGFTRTAMAQDFIDDYGESYLLDDIALTHLTEPDDVATIVTFLSSGLADHATGCTIDVNAASYVH